MLLSGGRIDWLGEQSSSPAEDMQEILLRFGIPEEKIWLQTESRNTEEDARFCLEILKENNVKRVLLVTSAMHMPRSVELFRGNGIEIVPAPTDYTVTEQGWYELFHPDLNSFLVNLMPNAGSLSLTTNVMKEYIGMAVYSIK
ncbi:MAG: YdcF family protein [Anaerolineaceae bacterium]